MRKSLRSRLAFEVLEARALLAASSLNLAAASGDTFLEIPAIATYGGDPAMTAASVATSTRQNPLNRLDVNGDAVVSPLDALLVIDRLNADSGGFHPPEDAAARDLYLDPSGDGFVTPIDALLVVDFLNGLTQAEAEPTVVSPIFRLDFGTRSSALKAGMSRVTSNDLFGANRSYGFVSAGSRDLNAKSREGYWGEHSAISCRAV